MFKKFFQTGVVSCGGLQEAIASDFDNPVGKIEMQVLGLIGKLLSAQWMVKFYTSASKQIISHVDGITVVKDVISVMNEYVENPMSVLTTSKDFFGSCLASDAHILQAPPADEDMFISMMKSCLCSIVDVLERQYNKYFELNIDERLKKESESVRSHNIDAEEIMGMFTAAKSHAPNATLCYLSSRIRAQKMSLLIIWTICL